jgi:hypothetical protein
MRRRGCVLREVASDLETRGQLHERRLVDRADVLRLPAAGALAAGVRWVHRAGHVARQADPPAMGPAFDVRDGTAESSDTM